MVDQIDQRQRPEGSIEPRLEATQQRHVFDVVLKRGFSLLLVFLVSGAEGDEW